MEVILFYNFYILTANYVANFLNYNNCRYIPPEITSSGSRGWKKQRQRGPEDLEEDRGQIQTGRRKRNRLY